MSVLGIVSTFHGALATVISAGLCCHVVFNRLEPTSLRLMGALLFVAPSLMTPLLLPHCSHVAGAAVSTIGIYLATLIVSTIVYRLSPFHPLAGYPGPFLNKVSKMWFTAIILRGKQHIYIQELHRKYGDIVRIGPNELSFCDVAAVAPILGPNGMIKGPYWDGRYGHAKERGIVALRDTDAHSRRRRIWSRGFSTDALKYYQSLLDLRVDQLLEALEHHAGFPKVELSKWISWFSYDYMNDLVFGVGPELMREGDKGGLWNMMENAQPAGTLLGHLPWISKLYLGLPIGRQRREFVDYGIARAAKRYQNGSPNKDLYYHLIDEAGVESERPSLKQVVIDSTVAIVAGSDTVSSAIPTTIWLLLRHPQVYLHLQTELSGVKDSEAGHVELARLPYLNAVINESLRLFPPVVSGSQRSPKRGSGGQMVGANFIPEGTATLVHTYSLQRDDRYFSHAEQFIPERWLPANERVALRPDIFSKKAVFMHDVAAFIPFSTGPTDCIGKKLAYQEMRAVLYALFKKFDMNFQDGFDPATYEKELLDYFVTVKGKLPIVLRMRL